MMNGQFDITSCRDVEEQVRVFLLKCGFQNIRVAKQAELIICEALHIYGDRIAIRIDVNRFDGLGHAIYMRVPIVCTPKAEKKEQIAAQQKILNTFNDQFGSVWSITIESGRPWDEFVFSYHSRSDYPHYHDNTRNN
jgi:hypothetical protein